MITAARIQGRNWHEAYLLLLSILSGLSGLVSGHSSRAIESTFPAWGQDAWYAGLIAGGALGLAGIVLEPGGDQETAPLDVLVKRLHRWRVGLVLEQAAMRILLGLCVAYVIGAFAVAPITEVATTFGAALVAAFALANAARTRQISRRLKMIDAAVSTPPGQARGSSWPLG